jgi:hypothetical protein
MHRGVIVAIRKTRLARAGKFKRGDKVRVKLGTRDVDYPDMPLGGWAGVITKVGGDGTYEVRWSPDTLALIDPVFKKWCERDGLEFELYCLGEDDLETDTDGPLKIEKPEEIVTRPLSSKDQDDRIRMVFGLTSDDPLPEVDDETSAVYHEYLSKNLVFPFTAIHGEDYGHPERVKVISLGDPDDEPMIDEKYGIVCEARVEKQLVDLPLVELEALTGKGNRKLLDDYCYWFHNWS